MKASPRSEVLSETDHVQERLGSPGVDTVLQELYSKEQAPSGKPVGPHVPDERALETFGDGAGI